MLRVPRRRRVPSGSTPGLRPCRFGSSVATAAVQNPRNHAPSRGQGRPAATPAPGSLGQAVSRPLEPQQGAVRQVLRQVDALGVLPSRPASAVGSQGRGSAGATGLEPATSGVTGVTKPFQPASPNRRIRQIMRISAGSTVQRFRLVAPGRFHRVSRRPGANRRSCPRWPRRCPPDNAKIATAGRTHRRSPGMSISASRLSSRD
jgi:hypothetical protein